MDAAAAEATAEKHAAEGTAAKEVADAGAKAAEVGAGTSGSGHVQVDSSPDVGDPDAMLPPLCLTI